MRYILSIDVNINYYKYRKVSSEKLKKLNRLISTIFVIPECFYRESN